jgi:hypothetical protein
VVYLEVGSPGSISLLVEVWYVSELVAMDRIEFSLEIGSPGLISVLGEVWYICKIYSSFVDFLLNSCNVCHLSRFQLYYWKKNIFFEREKYENKGKFGSSNIFG